MPDIQITDTLGAPVAPVSIDLANPSPLLNYLKAEALHLAVVPELLELRGRKLSDAAAKPLRFHAAAQHEFQLGNTKPEIDVTPGAQTTIRMNASAGSNLFDDDPFAVAATVPAATGYVSVGFEGALALGVSGSGGDLTFGFDDSGAVALQYLKAFPLGAGEPMVLDALAATMASYVIPGDLSDLEKLGVNDIATVSGQGSLKVSAEFDVSATPNPLASVNLPLGVGSIAVKAGATAGVSASFTLTGGYQIRARRKDAETIELSVLQQRGRALEAGISASGGFSADFGQTDLVKALLGLISGDPMGDQKLLADLQPAERDALTDAIKGGLDHGLAASLELAISKLTDDQAAFQYDIQPARLSPAAALAVHAALDGDLRSLTAMEESMPPGIVMRNSLLSETRQRGVNLRINLLGILNYLTVSELIRHSEVLHDTVTGEITIKETVTGTNINAVVEPLKRNEALRKVLYDSVIATTTYRAGKAVSLPDLGCRHVHFALNQNTNHQIMGDYLSWFLALNLMTAAEKSAILERFVDGGPSTCVLRTNFGDPECTAMFLDAGGQPRPESDYLEIGRRALRALLDPDHQEIDKLRYRIVDDALWKQAIEIGANVNLGPLVGLSTADVRVNLLIGDVYVVTKWAGAMADAAKLVQDMRAFVGTLDPSAIQSDIFKKKRDTLQKQLASAAKASKTRFDEPWGMVSLFWAAGSPQTAYAKAVTSSVIEERGSSDIGLQAGAGE